MATIDIIYSVSMRQDWLHLNFEQRNSFAASIKGPQSAGNLKINGFFFLIMDQ